MPQLKYLCRELKYTFNVQVFFCSLEPEWAAAATEVKEQTKGKVKLAAVDATVNQLLASRYGVSVAVRLIVFMLLHPVSQASLCGRRGDIWPFVMKLKHFIVNH